MKENNNANSDNVLISPEIKPEHCLISKTFGRHNVSMDKILELKEQGMGYRKIGAALGVNYKVIQRAYHKHLIETGQTQAKPASAIECNEIYRPLFKNHTLEHYFNIGQMIVSGYVNSNLNLKN